MRVLLVEDDEPVAESLRRGLLRYGFEVVGLARIMSATMVTNVASRRVMDKCGLVFQEEVTHRGALVVWYAMDRAGWQASQAAASR